MTEAQPIPIGPTRGERLALRTMQLGAIAVVLAVSTFNAFELDRFFVPKELALHVTALVAALFATALLGTISGAVVSGMFDAVLLLAVPAFLVWTALGALSAADPMEPRHVPRLAALALIAIAAIGAARSAAQLASMGIDATGGDRASLSRAAAIDPGNYRLQLRLARMGGRGRCAHARAAHGLFPSAAAAAAASRNCGE